VQEKRSSNPSAKSRYRRRRIAACACLLLAAALCGRAAAYLTASGFTDAVASVGSLTTPTIASATGGAGTVALSWTPVAAPGGGTVTYYATRAGGTVGGTCPSSPTGATTATSCTDTGLSRGTYTYTVTAIWNSWTATSPSSSANVSSGALDHFSVSAPANVIAGTSFTVTVTAQDVANNTVVAYGGSQALSFSGPANAPSGTAPAYPASVSFSNGAGNASVTLYDAQSTTLTATQASASGTSSPFTVGAGANHQIAASASSPQVAGVAFNVTLTAQDSWGNATGNLSGTKNMSFSGPANAPNGSAPVYPATVNFSGGGATASVTLKDAQTTTITATDTADGLIGVASGNVVVGPASASSFSVATPATAQTAGTAFNETLTALDAYGNQATGYTGSQAITFSGPTNAPNGTAPAYPGSVSFSNGAASTSVTLYDVQSTTLAATQGSVTGTSGAFTVLPGANHQVAASATSPQVAGVAFNVTLTAQDSWGNPTGNLSGTKSVSFSGPASSPNGSAPVYPATVSFSGGGATGSVTLKDAQTTTITAADTTDGLAGVASGNVVVGPASASSFSVATPATATAGTAFSASVTALDAYGNRATGYSGSQAVTFSGPANAPNGTAPGYPASVSFASGVGSASVTLYDAQSTTLTATQGTVSGTSGSFTVQPAGAAQILFTTQPGGVAAGAAFATQPAVTAKDAYGNVATGYAGTVTLSIKPGTGPAGATLSSCTSSLSGGVTTFTLCQVSLAGAGYQLNASDGTLNATSAAFTAAGPTTVSKSSAGAYTLTAPAGVTSFTFTMKGAGGGGGDSGANGAAGGAGGTVSGTITIPKSTTSTTFTVIVGGAGAGTTGPVGGAGGSGGAGCAAGGSGGTGTTGGGGGGGGATCMYLSGAPSGTIATVGGGGGGGASSTFATGGAGGGGPTSNPGTNTAGSAPAVFLDGGGAGGSTVTAGSFPFTITNTGGAGGTGPNANGGTGGTCSNGTCGAGGAGAGGAAYGAGGGGGGLASGGGGGDGGFVSLAAGGGGGSAYTGGAQSGSSNYTVTVSSASNGGGGAGGAAGAAGAAGSVSFTGPALTLT
jgi:hypothetical protein